MISGSVERRGSRLRNWWSGIGGQGSYLVVRIAYIALRRPQANKIAAVRPKSDFAGFTHSEVNVTGSTNNECHILFVGRCLDCARHDTKTSSEGYM